MVPYSRIDRENDDLLKKITFWPFLRLVDFPNNILISNIHILILKINKVNLMMPGKGKSLPSEHSIAQIEKISLTTLWVLRRLGKGDFILFFVKVL